MIANEYNFMIAIQPGQVVVMINKIRNSSNKIEDCASYLFRVSMNLTSVVRPPEN